MMDQPATAAVEEFVRAGYPLDAKAILLCEADGTPEEVAEEIARVRAVLEDSGATEIRVSRDEAERLQVLGRAQGRLPGGRGGSRPTTTAWTARFHAKRLGEMLTAIQAMEGNTACAA